MNETEQSKNKQSIKSEGKKKKMTESQKYFFRAIPMARHVLAALTLPWGGTRFDCLAQATYGSAEESWMS